MCRGMLLLVLSSIVIISMLTPGLEPIGYLFAALSTSLNVAPLVLMMASDMLVLIAGYWLASSLNAFLSVGGLLSEFLGRVYSGLGRVNRSFNRKGLVSLSVGFLIIALSYVPTIVDGALLQHPLHLLMHAFLLFAGGLIFVGFRRLSSNMKFLSYLLGCKGMAILGAYMLVTPAVLYNYFPHYEQVEAGSAMVVMCLASDATVIPLWLRRLFSK